MTRCQRVDLAAAGSAPHDTSVAILRNMIWAVFSGVSSAPVPSMSAVILGLFSFCPGKETHAMARRGAPSQALPLQDLVYSATPPAQARTSVLRPGESMLAGIKWNTLTPEPTSSLRRASAMPTPAASAVHPHPQCVLDGVTWGLRTRRARAREGTDRARPIWSRSRPSSPRTRSWPSRTRQR